jgi:hypothetical protein
MHTGDQRTRGGIEEFQCDIASHVLQQAIAANSESILGSIAAWIPGIDSRHRPRIGPDECGERKDTVAILASACGEGRNYGMGEARDCALARTAIVQRVLPQCLRQRIPRRCAYGLDAEIGTESFAVAAGALIPVRRRIFHLIDATRNRGDRYGIRPERIENVVVKLRRLRRLYAVGVRVSEGVAVPGAANAWASPQAGRAARQTTANSMSMGRRRSMMGRRSSNAKIEIAIIDPDMVYL